MAPTEKRFAVGRVEGEVGPVEVRSGSSAGAAGCPARIWGSGIGDGGDLGVLGIDVKRRADDDVAEVIGTGDRGGDHREAERRALVGAGEIDLAGDVDGVVAGAGAGDRRCRSGRRRAARACLLGEARVAGVGGLLRAPRRSSRGCRRGWPRSRGGW